MANIDVYKQYFSAECTYNGAARHGAVVWLNAESESGLIRYEAGVSFFPHLDEEDFAVSYDACGTKELLRTNGRRSKKRDALYLEQLREHIGTFYTLKYDEVAKSTSVLPGYFGEELV